MTLPSGRRAVARLGEFAVRANACLGVHAPEQAVIRWRHSRVMLTADELLLPAQRSTQRFFTCVETFLVEPHHATPPARSARELKAAENMRAACTARLKPCPFKT